MSQKFEGQCVLVVNGMPLFHLKSLSYDTEYSRELVRGQTATGQPVGMSDGPTMTSLELEVYIPRGGDSVSWGTITNGIIFVVGRDGVGEKVLAEGVFVTKVSKSNQETGTATKKISAKCTRFVEL